MTVTLHLSNETRRPQLEFAARVLLDCMGMNAPIEATTTSRSHADGLVLPGGTVIAEEELERVFDSVTLQREQATGRLDDLGRFDERAITWDTSKPQVDLLAKQITGKLAEAGHPVPPGKEPFRVVISHDIDRVCGREPTSLARSLMPLCGWRRSGWVSIATALSRDAFVENIRGLLEFESARGIGAHYFLLSGPYGLRRHSSRYDVSWRSARDTIRAIREADMTIGLHGSYYAKDRSSYAEERRRLEEAVGHPVLSHRNHYLRFDSQRIWNQLQSAGIKYDFSVGFRLRTGFRAGSARAVATFDAVTGRPSSVLSIPLLYMDNALLASDDETMLAALRAALQEVKDVAGCVSLLFHPELFLVDLRFRRFFEKAVALCEELDADLSGELPAR